MITNTVPSLKISIGNHPEIYPEDRDIIYDYDTIINVSDDPFKSLARKNQSTLCQIHWFPINEFGYWTYQPFFWIAHILMDNIDKENKVYLHCHAGAHRSPMMAYVYLRGLGNSPDEAFKLFEEHTDIDLKDKSANWLEEIFKNDVEYGRIPEDIVEFMKFVLKNPTRSLMEVMHDRDVLDLPQKTIDQQGKQKPVSKQQIFKWENDK
jgi:hypothetical protein